MKWFILSFSAGMTFAFGVTLLLMSDGEAFNSMRIQYYVDDQGRGLIGTDRFVAVINNPAKSSVGGGYITYKGKNGTIPSIWGGYGTGFSGGLSGYDTYTTYEPGFGRAILYLHGEIFTITDNGASLETGTNKYDISAGRMVISRSSDGKWSIVSSDKGDDICATFDRLTNWDKGELATIPPMAQDNSPKSGSRE